MARPAEESIVMALGENELRLCHMGVYALFGMSDKMAKVAHADPLFVRLSSAESVLAGRKSVAAAEATLVDPKASPYSPFYAGQAYKPGTVSVRLRSSEIARLIAGLDAFLRRKNPAMNGAKLVDPPELVRPLLERLRTAQGSFAAKADIARREHELLA